MIEFKTLVRCGLVWLVTFLFLFEGTRLLKAQESNHAEQNSAADLEKEKKFEVGENGVPAWFQDETKFTDELRTIYVRTEPNTPHTDDKEAEQALVDASILRVKNVLRDWLGIEDLGAVHINEELLKSKLKVDDHWVLGSEAFAELTLDDEFKAAVLKQCTDAVTRQRLVGSGVLGGSILALIAVAFGYLKMETATRGLYSRRLQTGSLVVVAILILLAYWIGRQFN